MTTEIVRRKPERMSFANLQSGETMEAQFNPTELSEELSANWGELEVTGLSHQPQQYQFTSNHTLKFKLDFAAIDSDGNKLNNILSARQYLLSLFYPMRGAQDVIGGAPPRFLFLWPNFISLTCNIHSIKLRHFHFGQDGRPLNFDADILIKEIRDVRLFSEDVLYDGTIRSGDAARFAGESNATS